MLSIDLQKWTATVILIVGAAVNGLGHYPFGPALLALGGLIWFTVAIQIRDQALIVTNAVMTLVTVAAILIHYL